MAKGGILYIYHDVHSPVYAGCQGSHGHMVSRCSHDVATASLYIAGTYGTSLDYMLIPRCFSSTLCGRGRRCLGQSDGCDDVLSRHVRSMVKVQSSSFLLSFLYGLYRRASAPLSLFFSFFLLHTLSIQSDRPYQNHDGVERSGRPTLQRTQDEE
jgi:hypothetical protein